MMMMMMMMKSQNKYKPSQAHYEIKYAFADIVSVFLIDKLLFTESIELDKTFTQIHFGPIFLFLGAQQLDSKSRPPHCSGL
jgi:hypothetical protein